MKPCGFCQTTDQDLQVLLLNSGHWKVFLSDNQSYFGRCIVLSTRHCPQLSQLNQAEWADLQSVIGQLEQAFTKALGATMFNWTCLMNKSYQAATPDPHVHFHLRPRYADPVDFNGHRFTDVDFGRHYDSQRNGALPEATTKALVALLRRHLGTASDTNEDGALSPT